MPFPPKRRPTDLARRMEAVNKGRRAVAHPDVALPLAIAEALQKHVPCGDGSDSVAPVGLCSAELVTQLIMGRLPVVGARLRLH